MLCLSLLFKSLCVLNVSYYFSSGIALPQKAHVLNTLACQLIHPKVRVLSMCTLHPGLTQELKNMHILSLEIQKQNAPSS